MIKTKNSILLYLCVVMGLCMTITSTQAQSDTTHTGNITVSTQAEVDSLSTTLSGKTIIDGNLIIGYEFGLSRSDITDLTPLSNIVRIAGNLTIRQNRQLVNLNGLNNLQSITGGDFRVNDNDTLTTLGNFPALQTIEGSFEVNDNNQLTILGNFSALQTIGGSFSVLQNNRLTTLGIFPVLTSIGIGNNRLIPSLEERKDSVSIVVENNNRLSDCYILTELLSGRVHAVSGDIYINNASNGCNSQNGIINSIYQGNITVSTRQEADELRYMLGNKTIIEGNLTVGYTDNGSTRSDIIDLVSLGNIVRITGNLNIQQNGQPIDLNGLNNLQIIEGYFSVQNNDLLTKLLGDFPQLMSIGMNDSVNIPSLNELKNNVSIVVEGNDRLSTCCVLMEFIPGGTHAVSGDIFINDNAMGCNSKSDINATTLTLTSSDDTIAYNRTYPIAIDFTVGCGATGWTSAITYMPANANFITLSPTGGRSRRTDRTGVSRRIDLTGVIIRATPTENTGVERTATITLSATGGTDTAASQTVVITQEALPDHIHVGNITVSTQAAVNALLNTLARKTTIRGNVIIGYIDGSSRSNITDLTPLSNITHITGNLIIRQNGQLVNLNGLHNLQSITRGDFRVTYNDRLTTLGNFPVLQNIGKFFDVAINDRLTTLGNFPALQHIEIYFSVLQNNKLTTLGNFSVLTSIGVGYGVDVPSLGGSRNDVSIVVENNSRLSDCYTLTELLSGRVHAVRGDIYINNNASNGDCNSQNGIINSIYQGNITVTTQAQVNALSDTLDGKTTIRGNLTIGYTDNDSTRSNITDLTPLTKIVRITGNLIIQQNGQLANLNPLTNLQSIGGVFNVLRNDQLTTLGNFPAFTSIGIDTVGVSIWVSDNPRLFTCCVLTDFFLGGVNAVSGGILINGNATGCDSESEINEINLTLTSSNESIAYNDTDSIAIDFTVGCGATGWTSAIAYMPANANFITLSSTGRTGQTGVITLMATPTGINTGVERTATITLSTTGGIGSQTVVITQEALPDYIYLGDITVSTQAAVNALSDTLAGKTRIRGNLIIGYTSGSSQSDIINLTPLSNITHITGTLTIRENGQLINLNDLQNLQSIGGHFQVGLNTKLTNFGDFPVLRSIGGHFNVYVNNRLTTLDFPVLQTIGGFLRVHDNDQLTTLDFPALTSIGIGALSSRNNEVSIVVQNNLRLSDCYTLTEFLSGGAHAVSGSVTIQNNDTNGGCNSQNGIMNSIYQGNITVTTQAQVNALRDTLAGKTRIAGNLTIGYTDNGSTSDITDLMPLRDIVRMTGNLNIQQNGQLVNLNGLDNLQAIGGYFSVQNNDSLTFLGNFALTSIGIDTGGVSISVSNNPRLSTCCVLTDFFSDGVNAVSGSISITGNAMGCNSKSEINVITLTLTSSNDTIAYNDTGFTAIDFTVGCGATGWTSAITYMPANANFITLSSAGRTGQTGVITLMARPTKNTGVERTATITLSTTGGTASQTVVITQEALPDHVHVGDVTLTDQAQVDSIRSTLGDSRITAIDGYLQIGSSNDITHLDSLYFLTEITGNFFIGGVNASNTALTNIGDFPNLQKIGGGYSVAGNPELIHGGNFPVLESIGDKFIASGGISGSQNAINVLHGYFFIRSNPKLESLGTFPRLKRIGTSFTVRSHNILRFLYDFPSLISIGEGNPYVPSEGDNSANTSIVVEGNPNLSDCYTLTEFLSGGATVVNGGIYINNNATGCSSGDEIMAAVPHTIMLTSHTDGDSIAIAYDEVVEQTIMFSIGGGATGWTSAITGDDFITLDTDMNVAQDTGVAITVRATPTENMGVARIATIRITTTGGTGTASTFTVTITQAAVPPMLTLSSPSTVTLAHDVVEAQMITFTVGGSASGWISAITGDNFITLSDDGNETGAVVVTADLAGANTGVERSAMITFTTEGGTGAAKDTTVTITQSAAPPIFILTSDSAETVAYDAETASDITFEVGGGATGWWAGVIDRDDDTNDFVTLSKISGSAGLDTIKVTTTVNTGGARVDTVVVGTGGVSDTVVITQSAGPPRLVVATNDMTIGHNSGDFAILFELGGTAEGWTSEVKGVGFITLDPSMDTTATGKVTIMATYEANDGVERTDTIIFTTPGGVADTVVITQSASPPRLVVATNDTTIGRNSGDFSILFELGGTAVGWEAEVKGVGFITLDPSMDTTATGEVTIMATYEANAGSERKDTIVFITTDGVSDTVVITQPASPPRLVVATNDTTIGHNSGDFSILFELGGTAVGWEVEVIGDDDFITLDPSMDTTATGKVTVMATYEANAGEERADTIVFTTTDGVSDTVVITQATAPTIMLTSHTDGDNIAIAHNDTDSITLNFILGGSATSSMSIISYMPENANFITLEPENNDEETRTITITLSVNEDTIPRTATITLRTTGHEGTPDSVSLTITQAAGAEPPLGVAPSKPFTLYPNPTNGMLTIEGVTGYLQVYIHDMVGRRVMTYSLTPSKKTIDVSDLPLGTYLVTVQGEDKTWTEILMKK